LEPRRTRHRAWRCRTTAGVRSIAVETARSDAAVVDVAEDVADGALEDEAMNASRVAVATDDVTASTMAFMEGAGLAIFYLGLSCSNSGKVPASFPANFLPTLGLLATAESSA
jgi:hypothetical protein